MLNWERIFFFGCLKTCTSSVWYLFRFEELSLLESTLLNKIDTKMAQNSSFSVTIVPVSTVHLRLLFVLLKLRLAAREKRCLWP